MTIEITQDLRANLEFREAVAPRVKDDVTLVFFHGMAHQANFYDESLKWFAENEGIHGVSVSLEGHGRSPLGMARSSINALRISDYKENILTALAEFPPEKPIVPVCHSMTGRCFDELLKERRLPENVRGVAFLAPVPTEGVAGSAAQATTVDFLRTGRPTPLSFAYALLVSRDIGTFVKSDPSRVEALFFSSDRGSDSRLLRVNGQTFCDEYLGPESCKAVWNILLPSRVSPSASSVPVLILGSENDRVIWPEALQRMVRKMKHHGHGASALKLLPELSHDIPMDIGFDRALGEIRLWLRTLDLSTGRGGLGVAVGME